MRNSVWISVLLLCAISFSAMADVTDEKRVVWFVGSESSGLLLDGGRLLASGAELRLEPASPGGLFAAAYYPKTGVLVTVGSDATVRLYEGNSERLRLKSTRKTDRVARTISVRLSSVPGLVYLLWDDVKKAEELSSSHIAVQSYSDLYVRLVLRKDAENWHAVPGDRKESSFLPIVYFLKTSKLLRMSMGDRKPIEITLPHPLAKPFRSGPGDPLAQAVFVIHPDGATGWYETETRVNGPIPANTPVIPPLGILFKTDGGWFVTTKPTGDFAKWFPCDNSNWWEDPYYKDGWFFVTKRTGPGGVTYRMDLAAGKLVPIEPQKAEQPEVTASPAEPVECDTAN